MVSRRVSSPPPISSPGIPILGAREEPRKLESSRSPALPTFFPIEYKEIESEFLLFSMPPDSGHALLKLRTTAVNEPIFGRKIACSRRRKMAPDSWRRNQIGHLDF